MASKKPIYFTNFNRGGLVENKFVGGLNHISNGSGITFHETSGIIKAQKSLVTDGEDLQERVAILVNPSYGARGLAFNRDGHVWSKTVLTSTWTEVYTGVGDQPYSAIEFDGYIYWTTSDKLHRKQINSTLDQTWSSVDNNWQTLTDTSHHPMVVIDQTLYIGDGSDIASVDNAGNFTASVVTLPQPYYASALGEFGLDLAIGTVQVNEQGSTNNYLGKTKIFRYPTWGDAFINAINVPGTQLPAFFNVDNLLCFTINEPDNSFGPQSIIYYYTGDGYRQLLRMPYDRNGSYVGPYMNATRDGLNYFAYKDKIYSLARNTVSGKYILTPEYEYPEIDGDQNYIYCIDPTLTYIAASPYDSVTYEVQTISNDRYDSAFIETPVIHSGIDPANYTDFVVPYISLPSGTSVNLQYDAGLTGSWTTISDLVNDTDRKQYISRQQISANYIQFRINFTVSGQDTPEILGLMCNRA